MATSRKISTISIAALLAFLAVGCAAPRPQTGPGVAEQPAAPQPAAVVQAPEPVTVVTVVQPETAIERPVEIPPMEPAVLPMKLPEAERIEVNRADQEFVRNRLNEYRNKLDLWVRVSEADQAGVPIERLSPRSIECMQLLERILAGYTMLLKEMQQNETVPVDKMADIDPKGAQQLDITFLESSCEGILTTDFTAPEPVTPLEGQQYSLEEYREIISSHLADKKYEEAVNWYAGMVKGYPDYQPDIITRMNYGLALQFSGRAEEAAGHFGEMLDSEELSIDPMRLHLEIADLYLAGGDIGAAESYYESYILSQRSIETEMAWAESQLDFLRTVDHDSDDMAAYTKLFREFQTHDYRFHGAMLNDKVNSFAREYTGSPVAVSALRLKEFTLAQLNAWFGRELLKVDRLVADMKYTDAAGILQGMTKFYLPADLQAVVQKTYFEVAQAEQHAIEEAQRQREMELNRKWDTAVSHMDNQRFEEAIKAFELLRGTEYEEKAEVKIVEAANLGAGKMRKEAATLFIQAGKTPDPYKKRELLISSYKLLTGIPVTFPQTDLLDKVKQNITILEEQIGRFDPTLLEELREPDMMETGPESDWPLPTEEEYFQY